MSKNHTSFLITYNKHLILFFLLVLLVIVTINRSYFIFIHPRHNVILVMIDTLRADHLPCYGYKLNTAPNLCRFAEEGIIFRNMFSQSPSTKPSIASLFTSTYPTQHKVVYNNDRLNDDFVTLAEILNKNGYHTLAVNDNPVIKTKFNYNQGFNVWHDTDLTNADIVNKTLFQELDKDQKGPYFIYVHYVDPHHPYTAPQPFYKHFNKDYDGKVNGDKPISRDYFRDKPKELSQLKLFYDNEIAYLDSKIARLFDKLKQKNMYDNSIIIITSDHGEMFMEHNNLQHSNGLYSEIINVPLIIKMPYSKKKLSIDAYVQTIDIFPTLLDILDITSENILMGNSIFSIKDKPNRIIFSEHLRLKWVNPQRSLIVGKHKLIRDLRNNKHLLYNMEEDELEKENILKINPESKSFINQMNLFLKEINTHYQNIKGSITDLDKKTYDQLKSLGYIN